MPEGVAETDVPTRDISCAARVICVLSALVLVGGLAWLVLRRPPADVPAHPVIVLYAYSTLEEPFREELLPAFRARWREEHDEPVEVVASFAASGLIVERILDRYPAEVAVLSSEVDAERLVGRLVTREAWRSLPRDGKLTQTPLALLVRAGNPHGVRGFADLSRPELTVLHPDPATSGAGVWSVLAAWGSALRADGDEARGVEALRALAAGVDRWLPSACEARRRFVAGEGDVLVGYEQDLARCVSAGRCAGEVVRPRPTILTEQVVVRIDRNVSPDSRGAVDAFVAWLWSAEARRILEDAGFDEDPSGASEPADDALVLRDLGGARRALRDVMEGVWQRRIRTPGGA